VITTTTTTVCTRATAPEPPMLRIDITTTKRTANTLTHAVLPSVNESLA